MLKYVTKAPPVRVRNKSWYPADVFLCTFIPAIPIPENRKERFSHVFDVSHNPIDHMLSVLLRCKSVCFY